jgi:SM-20-related protein
MNDIGVLSDLVDLARFKASPVVEQPFPHVVVPGFVRPQPLAAIQNELPPMAKGGSFPIGSLALGPRMKALVAELEGPEFRRAVSETFGIDLSGAATMTTLRGRSRDKDGRIHCDSTAKRVTILLYLNRDEKAWHNHQGCLRLLNGPGDLEDFAVEVPPVAGNLLVFPNGPNTWHGHHKYVGIRYALQMNYMSGDAAARSELRRHRISAFFKRFTKAA